MIAKPVDGNPREAGDVAFIRHRGCPFRTGRLGDRELDRLTDFLNKSLDVAEAKADALGLLEVKSTWKSCSGS